MDGSILFSIASIDLDIAFFHLRQLFGSVVNFDRFLAELSLALQKREPIFYQARSSQLMLLSFEA